jgi:hypothetical protein
VLDIKLLHYEHNWWVTNIRKGGRLVIMKYMRGRLVIINLMRGRLVISKDIGGRLDICRLIYEYIYRQISNLPLLIIKAILTTPAADTELPMV